MCSVHANVVPPKQWHAKRALLLLEILQTRTRTYTIYYHRLLFVCTALLTSTPPPITYTDTHTRMPEWQFNKYTWHYVCVCVFVWHVDGFVCAEFAFSMAPEPRTATNTPQYTTHIAHPQNDRETRPPQCDERTRARLQHDVLYQRHSRRQ